jgi:hypothetical protein
MFWSGELQAQGVGERPLRGLGGAVGTEFREGDPGQAGQDVQDCPATARRDLGRESADHGEGAEVVGVHLQADVVQVGGEQVGAGGGARVVDQDGHIAGGRGGGRDGGGVGDVERDRLGAGQVDLVGIAGAGVDGGAAAEQFGGEGPAEAPVGSGDKGGAGGEVHEGSR